MCQVVAYGSRIKKSSEGIEQDREFEAQHSFPYFIGKARTHEQAWCFIADPVRRGGYFNKGSESVHTGSG
jgi:hypothetical protein